MTLTFYNRGVSRNTPVTPTYPAAPFGRALDKLGATTEGVDTFLATPGVSSRIGNVQGQVEVRFKTTDSVTKVLLAHPTWWWLGHNSSGKLSLNVGGVSADGGSGSYTITSNVTVNDGLWHHAAVVFMGNGTIHLLCDGFRVASSSAVANTGSGSDDRFMVGGLWASNSTQFDSTGLFDEVRVSNVAHYTETSYAVPSTTFSEEASTVKIFNFEPEGVPDTQVTATAPTSSDPTGSGSDTYTIPSTTGVEYRIGGVAKASGTYSTSGASSVVVTAVGTVGYQLIGTSSWTLNFETAGTPVTATTPTSNDSVGFESDTYTIPSKTGVEYRVGGIAKAAGTYSTEGASSVTVTAVATSGYDLTGASSWVLSFNITIPEPDINHYRLGMEPLVWDGSAYPPRHPGASSVTFIGPTEPENWLPNDFWAKKE